MTNSSESPQTIFTDHDKQDLSLIAPTSNYKVIKFSPQISLQLRILQTPTPYVQSTFSIFNSSQGTLSIPEAIQESLELTPPLCSLD